jgi:hypothetical protein
VVPNQIIDGIEQAVGERVRQYWPNRSLIEAGALIAAGTDWLVIPNPDPWAGMQGLITRRNPDSKFADALWPEQAIDLPFAISGLHPESCTRHGLGGRHWLDR